MAGASNDGRLRVLIVEDNLLVADLTGELVQMFGHEVRVVNDGPAAIQVSAEFRPQVVLLDISLPGMNGYEVAKRLRQVSHADLILCAVTGFNDVQDRQRALNTGFDRHLVKPIEAEMLDEIFALAAAKRS